MRASSLKQGGGFSLIELVIVVVIIAIIGAIAIPKMSRGAAGAGDSALLQDLSVLRSAIDLYQIENGGSYPTAANMPGALLQYSDGSGNVSPTNTAPFIYGPYLQAIPPLPVGAAKGSVGIAVLGGSSSTQPSGIGWNYNFSTGKIKANTGRDEVDPKGTAYNTY